MRLIPNCVLILAMFAAFAAVRPAQAATGATGAHANAAWQTAGTAVDQHDGSRVGVQIVVAGIAAGLVVGVGSGAYLLRRKLGLTADAPDAAAGGHH